MFENLIFVFIIGFLSGVGFLAILFFLRKPKSSEKKDDTDLTSLKNHMQSIQQSLQNFNLAQDRIENTLIRGGAFQQGPWGEFVLKNILDSVGLREGEEYSTQKTFRDEDGNLQKPDVIVHMPGNRHIIIDSKVSLDSWHDYSNTNDNQQKKIFLKKFLDSTKTSIRSLSKDNYSKIYGINTIDNVLMFVPIEPALLTLYNEANKLIEDSWNNKIIIVGPSTLPFLLKAVENMWRVDKQSKTIKDIASAASDIYDKTVSVYESFAKANQSIDLAKSKMDEAKQRLQDGSGSLTKKVEKMKKLGRLSTKKQLPDINDDVIN